MSDLPMPSDGQPGHWTSVAWLTDVGTFQARRRVDGDVDTRDLRDGPGLRWSKAIRVTDAYWRAEGVAL